MPYAFRLIDSYEKAYLLGFMLADGCILDARYGRYRSRVNLKIKACDAHVCRMLYDLVGGNLRDIEGGYRVIWEVNSDEVAADFIALGVTSHKTFTASLNWALIPERLHGAVVAGLIDGDGHLRFDREKRRAEISIASGSITLRDQLLERFWFFKSVEIAPSGKRRNTLYRIEVQNHRERLKALIAVVYAPMPFQILARKQVVLDQLREFLDEQDAYDERMEQVASLKAEGRSIAEIASQVGTSVRPVMARLKAQGIDSRNLVFTEEDKERMRCLHEQGMSVLEIHAAIGKATEQAVRFHLQRMGCVKPSESKGLRAAPDLEEAIRKLHVSGEPAYRIATAMNVGVRQVRMILKDLGIVLHRGVAKKITDEQILWADGELRSGRTLKSIAKDLGVSDTLIRVRRQRWLQDHQEEANATDADRDENCTPESLTD